MKRGSKDYKGGTGTFFPSVSSHHIFHFQVLVDFFPVHYFILLSHHFKVCSQILGADFFVRNTSFAFDGFP